MGWTSVPSRRESLRAAPFAIPLATAFLLPSAHNDQVEVLREQHRRVPNRNDSFELVTRRDPDIDARSLEIRNRLRHIRLPAVGPRWEWRQARTPYARSTDEHGTITLIRFRADDKSMRLSNSYSSDSF
ncbi:hypothetical protein CF327_g47 [Tilletia walkeri]|nr:hypothetical protein CF327_g47 [Tilletia walkeri]